jgi:hypothetical protein
MKRLLLIAVVFLAACGQLSLPRPECDPGDTATSALHCDEAVRAALSSLPGNHPAITRIQFLYGSVTPGRGARAFPRGEQPVYAYVVFTWADASRRQYVDLTVYRGALMVGPPMPY